MDIPRSQPVDFVPLFSLEHERLMELLRSLSDDDWSRPTPCPGWDVLDLTSHLLGGSFGVISWLRDNHRGSTPPPDSTEEGFITWLDDLQDLWVRAARRISPRLLIELLDWTAKPFASAIAAQDPVAITAHVSWASSAPVPVWLDHARELTEKWIHRQQLLQALDRPSDLRPDIAGPVLDALRWAYPHRLQAHDPAEGSTVQIRVEDAEIGRIWRLTDSDKAWVFTELDDSQPVAQLHLTGEQAWRLLTNNYNPALHGPIGAIGNPEIVSTLRKTRAIIGLPR